MIDHRPELRGNGTDMAGDVNYRRWVKIEFLPLDALVDLVSGHEPPLDLYVKLKDPKAPLSDDSLSLLTWCHDDSSPQMIIRQRALDTIRSGDLGPSLTTPPKDPYTNVNAAMTYWFEPCKFVRWALEEGINVPAGLISECGIATSVAQARYTGKDAEPQLAAPEAPQRPTHSPDFRCVDWFGTEYTFTPTQAACVRVLWEAWEQRAPELGQDRIAADAESDAQRLRDVFTKGKHPAWGTMIVPGTTRSAFKLSAPEKK
jgi:hypothetical protein